jgi:hypothetical protein
MMRIVTKTLALSVLLGLMSCDKKNECISTELIVKSLETEYGCADTRYGLQIDLSETYTIIRTQQDFENKVSGNCIPKIDFSSYDLVIGKKGLTSGNASIDYNLTKDCKNILKLQVTFNQSVTQNAPIVTYHALIPKLGDEETVTVEFVYKN